MKIEKTCYLCRREWLVWTTPWWKRLVDWELGEETALCARCAKLTQNKPANTP